MFQTPKKNYRAKRRKDGEGGGQEGRRSVCNSHFQHARQLSSHLFKPTGIRMKTERIQSDPKKPNTKQRSLRSRRRNELASLPQPTFRYERTYRYSQWRQNGSVDAVNTTKTHGRARRDTDFSLCGFFFVAGYKKGLS